MSWTADLMAGLAQHLEDHHVGTFYVTGAAYSANQTAIVFDQVPASPDRIIALTPYGIADSPTQAESDVSFQVRVRGTRDPRTAYELDDEASDALHNLPRTVLGGVTVAGCWRTSSAYLGVDQNGRHERVSNYLARAHRPSPHRI